jgi:hypothetical protein
MGVATGRTRPEYGTDVLHARGKPPRSCPNLTPKRRTVFACRLSRSAVIIASYHSPRSKMSNTTVPHLSLALAGPVSPQCSTIRFVPTIINMYFGVTVTAYCRGSGRAGANGQTNANDAHSTWTRQVPQLTGSRSFWVDMMALSLALLSSRCGSVG